MIHALQMLKDAQKDGFNFEVQEGGDIIYKGTNGKDAWKAVESVEEADVWLIKKGAKSEWSYLMEPGPSTVADDETIANYTCGGFIEAWCDKHFEEA